MLRASRGSPDTGPGHSRCQRVKEMLCQTSTRARNLVSPSPSFQQKHINTPSLKYEIVKNITAHFLSCAFFIFAVIKKQNALQPQWKLGGVVRMGECQDRTSPQNPEAQLTNATVTPRRRFSCPCFQPGAISLSPHSFSQDDSAHGSQAGRRWETFDVLIQ